MTRPSTVRVTGLDRDAKPLDFEASGLYAVCIQHELDHLIGKVFLDRMADLDLEAYFGGAPPGFSLQEFADRSFGAFQEPPEHICLRFDANVADAARQFHFHVTQQFTELGDGRLEVRFHAGGLLEVARHIFSWGGTAEIIEPPQLRALLLRELDAVSARHR